MAAVLLETTVLIDLLRGREGAKARLLALHAAGDVPHACAINVEETVRGLAPDEGDAATALFGGLRFADLGEVEGWRAGEWRREFARRGRTLA